MKVFILLFALVLSFPLLAQNSEKTKEVSLKKGDMAPDFILKDTAEKEFKLSSYRGQIPVVVYFYPQANTSGCTKQACGIRDNKAKFFEAGIQVVGISTDNIKEIRKFRDDYSLDFLLLSDADKSVAKKYGVLQENGHAKRVTFIIDRKGKIAEIIKVDDIEHHADKVYDIASKL